MMEGKDVKNLKFRYLLWFYKTAREEFDLVERKFTQLEVDKKIIKNLKEAMSTLDIAEKERMTKYYKEFKEYINKKQKEGKNLKFDKELLRPEYQFLTLKLKAIEAIIIQDLGEEAKNTIKTLYEEEMKKRILESKEHK
ncbi:MAG: hypothetical protein ABH836_06535 [Candidatus Omnitrophota bacterium]